jgi:protein SCO1/2
MKSALALFCLFLLPALCAAPIARADVRPPILQGVGIDQKLDAPVPGDLVFGDEAGDPVRLGSYLGQRPVILLLIYYKCPMSCSFQREDLIRTMNIMSLNAAQDYEVISVSIDPTETAQTASEAKADYLRQYKRAGAAQGWHFLTGSDASIRQLADAVGYHYNYDPVYKQYAHADAIMVLTPQGRVSRYFFGLDYAPKDVRLALVEASGEKIGSLTDAILLFCFHYDASTNKYTLAVTNLLRVGGALTVLALGAFLFVNLRREKMKTAAPARECDSAKIV